MTHVETTSPVAVRAMLRAAGPYAVIAVVGMLIPIIAPSALLVSMVLAIGAATIGALRGREASVAAVIRDTLLGASAFVYPAFLGGYVLPSAAALGTAALLAAGWVTTAPAVRERVVAAQVLAIALAIGIATAAVQFFFPSAWVLVSIAAVAAFTALLLTAVPGGTVGYAPSPFTCALVLVISEGLIVLRQLPAHWAINGTVIALAFAAACERGRIPRTAFASLLVILILLGATAS